MQRIISVINDTIRQRGVQCLPCDRVNLDYDRHREYANPKKSPWNFEKYQSDLECRMMDRLERDPHVVNWMKRHGISIAHVKKGLVT